MQDCFHVELRVEHSLKAVHEIVFVMCFNFLLQFCCGHTEKYQSGHQETGPPIPVRHPRQEDVPRAAHVKAHEP